MFVLALQHHPDTAMNKEDSKHHSAEFIKISEAWSILSRPEIRTRYDVLRGRYLGLGDKFGSLTMSGLANSIHSDIPVGYNTQKVNFGRVQHHAGATMEDTLSRSRMEKWQSTPLSEKKVR
jgi:DnaJ-class molecular chaperone